MPNGKLEADHNILLNKGKTKMNLYNRIVII